MRVTSKGQVTIPQEVREDIGIEPASTEIDFKKNKDGRWYLVKVKVAGKSRFRTAHAKAKLTMTTDEILALTRG